MTEEIRGRFDEMDSKLARIDEALKNGYYRRRMERVFMWAVSICMPLALAAFTYIASSLGEFRRDIAVIKADISNHIAVDNERFDRLCKDIQKLEEHHVD